MRSSATDCARARESVSLQLDGELPELELDRLETHLRICPDCSEWAQQVRLVTRQLRETALAAPEEPFVLPRQGRRWRVGSAVALTSAAAVVATMFVAPGQHAFLGSLNAGGSPPHTTQAPDIKLVYPNQLDVLIPGVSFPVTGPWPVQPL